MNNPRVLHAAVQRHACAVLLPVTEFPTLGALHSRSGLAIGDPRRGRRRRLVESMTDAGYTFVTVSELLAARGQDPRAESPVGRVPIAHNAGKCGIVSRRRTGGAT